MLKTQCFYCCAPDSILGWGNEIPQAIWCSQKKGGGEKQIYGYQREIGVNELGVCEDARLAHWKFYTVAEKDPEYMDRYSIAMERLKKIGRAHV